MFSFNGSTLSLLTSQNYGNVVYSLDWNPDGTVLAVGGLTPTNGNETQLYSFNGSTISLLTSLNYGSNVYSVDWNLAGTILAVGGYNPANGNELHLCSFDGSTLSLIASQDYGPAAVNQSRINDLAWNPDGTVLAIGGESPTAVGGFSNANEFRLYGASFTISYQVFQSPSTANMLTFGNSALGEDYDLSVEVLGGAHVISNVFMNDDSA